MKGGYQIVDLHGVELSGDAVTIPGTYESVEGNHHKPVLLSGITIGGIERADVYTTPATNAGNYALPAYNGVITITSDDAVTYTANA